ncbi:ImmA/IrrE family metallo-endopeptidase [Arcanobacterium haemolyticum]
MNIEGVIRLALNIDIDVVFLPFPKAGAYLHTYGLIVIDARMSEKRQLATLAHEYIHALLGHDGPQPPNIEAYVDMRAAALIVDSAEYALAERLHEGNAVGIAEELGVPIWVVKAYREALCCESHRYRVGVFI